VIVEAAMGEARGLHQVVDRNAVETTFAKKLRGFGNNPLPILFGLILSNPHDQSPNRHFTTMIYIIIKD
jgi:hypothetical protein